MTRFTLHTPDTAAPAAAEKLRAVEAQWKFIPNLHRILAESPETLAAYDTLFGLVAKTSFTPAEQQVAFLAVIQANECEYCMAGHSVLAKLAHVAPETIAALRDDQALADARLEALRRFAADVTLRRGQVGDAAVDAFIAAGFTQQNVLEVVLIVATKTISNYVNHIAHTPNDAFMQGTAWVAPSRRLAA
jgi:uncharacterized peroxidase-related enzyme